MQNLVYHHEQLKRGHYHGLGQETRKIAVRKSRIPNLNIQQSFNEGHNPPSSLLPCLDGIPILACDDLYPRCTNLVVAFHFETWILHYERPHVVTKTVCMQMALEYRGRL
jgi:hypothetical protein